MKKRPDSKNEVIKAGKFPQGTIKKLESSKEINKNGKKSYKEVI